MKLVSDLDPQDSNQIQIWDWVFDFFYSALKSIILRFAQKENERVERCRNAWKEID